MADVSHELRTPLAIMRGELEAMEDGLQPLDGRSIQSLQSEVAVLSKLVDDIHQLSIADVGSLSYRRVSFDVVEVLEQGVDAFRDRLQARGIVPELQAPAEPLVVVGDPERLQQVFHNILENAVRYADQDARLRIDCRRRGGDVEIGFHDSGPGVPDETPGQAVRPLLPGRRLAQPGNRRLRTGPFHLPEHRGRARRQPDRRPFAAGRPGIDPAAAGRGGDRRGRKHEYWRHDEG